MIYGEFSPRIKSAIEKLSIAERERVMSAPDSDIPTERCIDGRVISITQKKMAYRYLDEICSKPDLEKL